MSAWAVCPVCSVVVVDPHAHAAWHALGVAEVEALTGGESVPAERGSTWPADIPVPQPALVDTAQLARLRDSATEWAGKVAAAQRAIDTYLAAGTPTTPDVVAQIRLLSVTTRALLTVTRSLAAHLLRTPEEP